MGINTNALAVGGPMPAKTASNPDAGPASQANSPAGSGSVPTTPPPPTPERGSAPSTQTRNAQAAQSRGNSRATRARPKATNSSPDAASAGPQDAAQDSANDFGSVMASALVRGTSGTAGAVAVTASAGTTDSTPATADQPAAGNPADAVAWIAQALTPSVMGARTLTPAPGTAPAAEVAAADGTGAVAAGGTVASAAPPANSGLPLARTKTPVAPGAQLAPQDSTADLNVPPVAPGPVAPTTDAASAAATPVTADNASALAGIQKLISGLTGTQSGDSDTDTDRGAAAPKTHAVTAGADPDTTQSAATLQAAALTRPDSSLGGAVLTIHAPVGSAAFADEVGARATGLAQAGITQAQLQLNPADLGPVQVHITLQAGQASVWFGATHADTRAALEQSLPQLRELFAGAGMPLADSGVFREPPQQQQAQSLPATGSARDTGDALVAPTVTQVAHIRLGLLDTYA